MNRSPQQCPYRTPPGAMAGDEVASCKLLARVLGVRDPSVCAVTRDACEACCRSLSPPEDLNPVLAALAFQAAGRIAGDPRASAPDVARARGVQQRVVHHLGFVHAGLPERCFPPETPLQDSRVELSTPSSIVNHQPSTPPVAALTWQTGMLTAPRAAPRIEETLQSLQAAGFAPVHIFAEPGSWIPPQASEHFLVVHSKRLGNFANFYTALATLYERRGDADVFAIFQDDVRVARGARAWCESQFWPLNSGLVSLFTPRLHGDRRSGWRLLSPGFHRVFGGQALALRRDVLERFLADPHVLRALESGRYNDDSVVGGWATRQGLGIAYHTPSLVQHTGVVSSIYAGGPEPRVIADAVDAVDQIPAWQPPARAPGRIGLVGWHTASGLGYQTYDLAVHLDVDRWLIPRHPTFPTRPDPKLNCRIEYASLNAGRGTLRSWLEGLHWVLFVERPYLPGLVETAREQHVSVACVPNWEWLHPEFEWLSLVDLMICPTRHTFAHICDWRRRYGFGWDVHYVPWPVDSKRFRFRSRRRCRRFVFVNGWGGGHARRLDGSTTAYARKGIELIAEAARAAPHIPWLVYSQCVDLPELPPQVEIRKPPADNRKLYHQGDVCVQPSHWEGLGLQLLECQAAGMPLITTDAPPMNEYQPLDTIPVADCEVVQLCCDQPIPSQIMTAAELVRVLKRWSGADILVASRRAREFIETEHSWTQAKKLLHEQLVAYD